MDHSIIGTEMTSSVYRKESLLQIINCQLYMNFKFKFERQKYFKKKFYALGNVHWQDNG